LGAGLAVPDIPGIDGIRGIDLLRWAAMLRLEFATERTTIAFLAEHATSF
jgi:hypothetical protein